MPIPISVVDAFSDRPFRGNPAGVCLPHRDMDSEWMQSVAAEMNLAETAFLRAREPDEFDLRWFTPRVEVDLCGHATLASAHRLWEEGLAQGAIGFHTRSGILTASRSADGIELDFPSQPPRSAGAAGSVGSARRTDPVDGSERARRPGGRAAGRARDPEPEPDFAARADPAARIVVTAAAERTDSDHDFVSRFPAPRSGSTRIR
jgi:predicted PhzF superfamily epimerase YddE/YHI9